MLMAKSSDSAAPLADKIVGVIEESGATPDVAATALAALLGSVCREGRTDLKTAVEVAELASGVDTRSGRG